MKRRALILFSVMIAALVAASGVALAVNKVCPSGTTFANPCKGTAKTKRSSGNDTLIGTSGADYIFALSGNDKISAGAGDDYTDGGAGNDTYSYKSGWGRDTVVDASGFDTLNFAALSGSVSGYLTPEYSGAPSNSLSDSAGNVVNVSSSPSSPYSVIEKVVGSASGNDFIVTGGAVNILQPGPGPGGGHLADLGGCNPSFCGSSIPASNDTYSGLSASGYGAVTIEDYGGTADKLILPFASTDAYFEASAEHLTIMTTSTDSVTILGQLQPWAGGIPGHIETITFTDGNFSIGSASVTAAATSASPTAQVDNLNAATTLSASKKDELAKAGKKLLSKAPSPTATSPEDIKPPKK